MFQDCYVMNLLQLLGYAPSLTALVLELIVTKLIEIDVSFILTACYLANIAVGYHDSLVSVPD